MAWSCPSHSHPVHLHLQSNHPPVVLAEHGLKHLAGLRLELSHTIHAVCAEVLGPAVHAEVQLHAVQETWPKDLRQQTGTLIWQG